MAQLTDDCFAFGGPMMSVDEAVGIIAARVAAVRDVETVALDDADGRILASQICAPLPLPPFTNSAVDGYAIGSGDLPRQQEQAFAVTGRIQAGAPAGDAIKPGHAVRIFTGAPMPMGADTVFMQEDVRIDGDGKVCAAGGVETRRQCAPRRRGHFRRACRVGGGPAVAAAGRRARRCVRVDASWRDQAYPRRGIFHRQ